MPAPFETAAEAAAECVALWETLGDAEGLADAWAASAAVDFYSVRSAEALTRAQGRTRLIAARCRRLRRRVAPHDPGPSPFRLFLRCARAHSRLLLVPRKACARGRTCLQIGRTEAMEAVTSRRSCKDAATVSE